MFTKKSLNLSSSNAEILKSAGGSEEEAEITAEVSGAVINPAFTNILMGQESIIY